MVDNNPESKNTEIMEIGRLKYHFKPPNFEIVKVKKTSEINGSIVNASFPFKLFSVIASQFLVLCKFIEPMLIKNNNAVITRIIVMRNKFKILNLNYNSGHIKVKIIGTLSPITYLFYFITSNDLLLIYKSLIK